MDYGKLGDEPGKRRKSGFDPSVGKRTQFQPGKSGNPSGRPSKSLMQRRLEELANDPQFVEEWIVAAAKRMKEKGVAGFLQSRETLDRVDGPVTQQMAMEVTGKVTLESVLEAKKKAGK